MTAAAIPLPIIPDNPNLSWATMAISTMVLLDVSTGIGEYHRALEASPSWTSEFRRLRQGRKAVNRASLEVICVAFCLTALSAAIVSHATANMDWRMRLVLEGVSRLDAAWFLFFVSIKTPRWIGVYYSPQKMRIQHVGEGLKVLRFHVRWSICQYFCFVYCFLLPYCGRPMSVVLGFAAGFVINGAIHVARKKPATLQARIALGLALILALISSVLFADGCHYIQIVWGTGPWRNEWGLGLVSFFTWFAAISLMHWRIWRQTEKKIVTEGRFSVYDTEERMAISLIFSRVFGSHVRPMIPPDVLKEFQEKDEDENGGDKQVTPESEVDIDPTTWSLIKTRWSTPSELVFMSRADNIILVLVSILSLFVVVVNIGATAQMNTVRLRFHDAHQALYGHMEKGPVCAFDKVNGTIITFEDRAAAQSAGYKVAHCGACAACSDWHNLRLQYTTREFLAKESARCARKSLIGGRDAVLNCLKQAPIGFEGKCAECWTQDIFCARSHCAFIFLQSNMINTFANFQVGEDTITAATCEEAMCELEFVPCSGANRRRMSITSTIKRPGRQLCGIVDVDWAEVFGEDEPSSLPSVGSGKEEL